MIELKKVPGWPLQSSAVEARRQPGGRKVRLPEEAQTMLSALPLLRLLVGLAQHPDTPPVQEGN